MNGLIGLMLAATLVAPMDDYHSPTNRRFTGIPSVAVSQKTGRLWMTYYASCTDGEDSNNYSVLATSADNGESWKEVLVADPDGKGPVRSFDPEVWIGPDNRLRWTWSERVTPVRDGEKNRFLDGGKELKQDDRIWMVELDPDKVDLAPIAAREIGRGIMMCKPIVTKDGRWLFPNAHWGAAPSACVLESRDAAKTFRELSGVTLPEDIREYDEHNLVELKNGRIRAYMRTNAKDGHATWQAESSDGGVTWGEPKACDFCQQSSRIFVRRLMDGRLLLVKNGGLNEKLDKREKMMAFVSDDDGRTWRGGLMLWENFYCSYPDGDQGADGTIYLVFDGNRFGENREMYFVRFTVDDVLAGRPVSARHRLIRLHEAGMVIIDENQGRREVLRRCGTKVSRYGLRCSDLDFEIKVAQGVFLRPYDVLSHPEFCSARILCEYGLGHAMMIAPGPGDVFQVAVMRMKAEKAVSAVGGGNDAFGESVPGSLQDQKMLRKIMGKEILLVLSREDALTGLPELFNDLALSGRMIGKCLSVGICHVGNGNPDLTTFDCLADFVKLNQVFSGKCADISSRLAFLKKRALFNQTANGFSHRHATDAAGLRQRTLGQLRAGCELSALEQLRDVGVGHVTKGNIFHNRLLYQIRFGIDGSESEWYNAAKWYTSYEVV